jgi:allantoate deiminase
MSTLGERALLWCDELSTLTQTPGLMDRRYLTHEHRRANDTVADWMQNIGLQTWQDEAGNQWGRMAASDPDAPVIVRGSHLDTVPNGGIYDGILDVVLPLLVIESLKKDAIELPFHLDLVGFGDAEGTRFGATLLGSRAIAGTWDPKWETLKDGNGESLPDAFNAFDLNYAHVTRAARTANPPLAFLEMHIEQGPVLESEDLPVGIVTAIAGARRFNIELTGMAGHAGTVPMHLRQDALAAASEITLIVERVAREHGVVATVGRMEVKPGAVNVIAGQATFSLDIRSEQDSERDAALTMIWDTARVACHERGIKMQWQETHAAPAVSCADHLQLALANAIESEGIRPRYLVSGAGHDAMAMAALCPVAMLFMRCEKGISHHPDEAVTAEDTDITAKVLRGWIEALARQQEQES